MPESAYIHIPFCKSKCKYCSFVSYNKPKLMKGYVFALLKDISTNYSNEPLKTLYFGGGTPSLLPVDLLHLIMKNFTLAPDCEVTLEINPDDASEEYLSVLRKIGINRLSIGSQTFDDSVLKLIGRRHSASDIEKTVRLAKHAGFENISVDLIYGLPTQTVEGLKKDLDKFLELGIQHISTYGLKIEEGSFWGKHVPENLPDDDLQADMYEIVNGVLENNGFYRYEISNFAQKGFESRHNLNYWNNDEYYGFGCAAHGYADGVRYSNFVELEKYIYSPDVHETGHLLTKAEKLEEEIFLGFRKTEGVNVERIKTKFGVDFKDKYKAILSKYKDFIEPTQYGYRLNIAGVLISNVILAEFI